MEMSKGVSLLRTAQSLLTGRTIKPCNTFYSIIHFTFYCLDAQFTASIAQLVECLLLEWEVVRSNPAAAPYQGVKNPLLTLA